MMERDEQCLGVGVRGVEHAPAKYEAPPDEYAMEHFRSVLREGIYELPVHSLGAASGNATYRARLAGDTVEVFEERSGRVVGTLPAPGFEAMHSRLQQALIARS